MELKINPIALPEKVTFNDEEIETALSAKLEELRTVVYTDAQIKEAKTDKANLNRLKKALSDERIRVKKEFMIPVEDFENKIKRFCSMIDEVVNRIDFQVKEYDEKRKQEKADKISEIWQQMDKPDWLDLGDIYGDKWLNTTYSLKQIEEELQQIIAGVNNDIKTIEALEAFRFEAMEEYKRTLNLAQAIREGQRLADLQRRKEEDEKRRAAEAAFRMAQAQAKMEMAAAERTEDPEQMQIKIETIEEAAAEERQPVAFRAYMTYAQALELRAWFVTNGIEFEPIR